jgi:EmrB/QacA subfamily drug resistance transporter
MKAGKTGERGGRTATYVLIAMTLANAMILVDQTAVPLALPDIMKTFDTGSKQVQWVLNCSLLPLAGLLVFAGRLGDLVGLRKVFLLGSVTFISGSVIAGFAPALEVLLAARVVQGVGGALMLPLTIAIVSAAFPASERGKALGTMGGAAAVFAALGPTIGGVLTETFSWRAVLLINVPLAAVAIAMTLRRVEDHRPTKDDASHVDTAGTVLLSIGLVGLVFGLSQSGLWGWGSPGVIVPLIASVLAAIGFVIHERDATSPLVDFRLLRERNYLGASLSQLLSGMAEIGLGVIFPLLLILNLEMSPALAGLALIPTTLPMIAVAPLAGRWYDRGGGRPPLVVGFLLLAASGVLLAIGVGADSFMSLLPGLLLYGIGLSLVLTVNDPVSLDQIPGADHGQASGVSATAEQFGGALGIAVLYSVFHGAYLNDLESRIDRSSLPDLTSATGDALRNAIGAAEATGLHPGSFDPRVKEYLGVAEKASNHGYTITFLVVAAIALLGAGLVAWLVRRSETDPESGTDGGGPEDWQANLAHVSR